MLKIELQRRQVRDEDEIVEFILVMRIEAAGEQVEVELGSLQRAGNAHHDHAVFELRNLVYDQGLRIHFDTQRIQMNLPVRRAVRGVRGREIGGRHQENEAVAHPRATSTVGSVGYEGGKYRVDPAVAVDVSRAHPRSQPVGRLADELPGAVSRGDAVQIDDRIHHPILRVRGMQGPPRMRTTAPLDRTAVPQTFK